MSDEEIIEVAQAILTKVESELPKLADKLIAARVGNESTALTKSYSDALGSAMRTFEREIEHRLENKALALQKSVEGNYDGEMARKTALLQDACMTGMVVASKKLEEKLTKEMGDRLNSAIGSFEERLKSLERSLENKSSSLIKMYEDGLEHIKSIVQALPTPHVSLVVPENAINVNVEHEPVEVNIQDKAFHVQIDQKLEIPKRTTKSEKSIIYGPSGRPESIVEKTSEE